MKIRDFVKQIGLPVFTTEQALRVLPPSERGQLNVQLARWAARGEIERLKRKLYVVADKEIDEVVISNYLCQPSYVSMETALNLMGVIPDVSASVTAVTTVRPRGYATPRGTFTYGKIKQNLYFGYQLVDDEVSGLTYRIAYPEKALLDYMYIRRIRDLRDIRIEWAVLQKIRLFEMMREYPHWITKEIKKYV